MKEKVMDVFNISSLSSILFTLWLDKMFYAFYIRSYATMNIRNLSLFWGNLYVPNHRMVYDLNRSPNQVIILECVYMHVTFLLKSIYRWGICTMKLQNVGFTSAFINYLLIKSILK